MLVSSVYLFYIVYAACSLGAHCCYQERYSGSYVRAGHSSGAEAALVVVSYDDGSVRVA